MFISIYICTGETINACSIIIFIVVKMKNLNFCTVTAFSFKFEFKNIIIYYFILCVIQYIAKNWVVLLSTYSFYFNINFEDFFNKILYLITVAWLLFTMITYIPIASNKFFNFIQLLLNFKVIGFIDSNRIVIPVSFILSDKNFKNQYRKK